MIRELCRNVQTMFNTADQMPVQMSLAIDRQQVSEILEYYSRRYGTWSNK
jgi:hypothetical protein